MNQLSSDMNSRKPVNSSNQISQRKRKLSKTYVLLEFATKEIYVVHRSWITNNEFSFFPPLNWQKNKIHRAIERGDIPTSNYRQYKIKRCISDFDSMVDALAGLKTVEGLNSSELEDNMDFQVLSLKTRALRHKKKVDDMVPSENKRSRIDDEDEDDGDDENEDDQEELDEDEDDEDDNDEDKDGEDDIKKNREMSVNVRNRTFSEASTTHCPEDLYINELRVEMLKIQKEQYNELRTEVLDKQEEQHNIIKNILQNGFKEMLKNHHEQRLILEAIAKKEQNTSADMQNQHHLMLNDIFEHDEILSKMPFSSDDEINTFDEKLTDKEFKVLTARAYSSLGSTTPKDCVVAMMTKTFKNSVAAGWSWTGRVKGKNDFKVKKNIVCILRSVARRKYGLNTVTENDVKQWCSEWLKHAPKRRNRENEKILRTIQENEALEDLLNTETEM
ncbi:kinesin-related protein 4-like [Leptopilina boulardi]|uniref:kinesin-related protein 4-like n=1 Tax=Leptopilina boulardi TaxID=63433 RepID=UPI0021F64CA2|nr:kinesin-related protein 4-like [Leptopilina boulardi]